MTDINKVEKPILIIIRLFVLKTFWPWVKISPKINTPLCPIHTHTPMQARTHAHIHTHLHIHMHLKHYFKNNLFYSKNILTRSGHISKSQQPTDTHTCTHTHTYITEKFQSPTSAQHHSFFRIIWISKFQDLLLWKKKWWPPLCTYLLRKVFFSPQKWLNWKKRNYIGFNLRRDW